MIRNNIKSSVRKKDMLIKRPTSTSTSTSTLETGERSRSVVINNMVDFREAGCWVPGKNGQKAEKVFKNELDLIDKEAIRDFVLECFDKFCPDYFWTAPSSTTGKWHPKYAQGKGGIIRHTKAAVWWGIELMKPFSISDEYKSVVVASLILHDLRKNGDSLEEKAKKGYAITKTHGVDLVGKMASDSGYTNVGSAPAWKEYIFRAISSHMGIWTSPTILAPYLLTAFQGNKDNDSDNDAVMNTITMEVVKSTQELIALVVHLADYCASRKIENMLKEIKK